MGAERGHSAAPCLTGRRIPKAKRFEIIPRVVQKSLRALIVEIRLPGPGSVNSGATPPLNERTLEIDWPQAFEFNDGSMKRSRTSPDSARGNTEIDRMGGVIRWPNLFEVTPYFNDVCVPGME